MNKRKHIRIFLALALAMLSGVLLNAQTSMHVNAAFMYLQQGQIDSAKKEIDLRMKEPGAANDPDSWYINGFVYKELYKKYENTNVESPYRIVAKDAFIKSIGIDTSKVRIQATRDNLRYLGSRFYNDAAQTLDTLNYKKSTINYNYYRECTLAAEPNFNIKTKDVEYYNALGTMFNTAYTADKKANIKYFDLARDTYLKVLTIDPNDYKANFNMGLLYWNKGVDVIYNDINLDDSIDVVFDMQDRSVEMFKQSLPYAEKAYLMEPKREETLIVLSGIYYSLNDFQKSQMFQQMLEDLRKQK